MSRSTSPNARCGAVVFRLLLVMALWEGPVLWGHAHKDGQAALSEHIAQFHKAESAPLSLGWHWHFSLPDFDGDGQTDDERPVRSRSTVVVSFEGPQGLVSSDFGSTIDAMADGSLIPAQAGMGRSAQRLTTILDTSTRPPQLLLCRWNC